VISGSIIHNVHNAPSPPDCGDLYVETVSSTGLIESRKADIPFFDVDVDLAGTLRATGGGNIDEVSGDGVITGTIEATEGKITTIDLDDTQDIGTTTTNATITAKNGIDLIDCAALYADVTANANSGSGGVRRIITWVGPFLGSLDAEYVGEAGVPNWLNVRTDLGAVITSTDALEQRAFIGRSFLEDAEINLPSGGLQNVITINTQGNEDAVWEGTVTVGTTALTAPDYTTSNTSLGNGGVAMVEFDDPDLFRTGVQGTDCEPVHNSIVVLASTSPNDGLYEVTMRFYGYVDIDGSEPLTIAMSPFNNQWISDVTDEYQVELGDPVVVADNLVRELVISRIDEDPFPYGYKFTFTPTTDLQSDGTSIDYDIASDAYWFWISQPFDLNQNMVVDAPDIDVWLNDPSDLNGDNFTDQQDLEDLVEAVVNGG